MDDWQKILIQQALQEDAAMHDLTALATMPAGAMAKARITAKADGVLSGVAIADAVFAALDATIERSWQVPDGASVHCGDSVCELSGPVVSLLSAERTALNFLQHLSGIATATRTFVDAVAGTDCRIADTRKTTPGFRHMEKQAVLHGGGLNHRMDLQSGMLIKENHIEACGSIAAAVHACYQAGHKIWVEVECESLDEVSQAVEVCPDIILLDNMEPAMVAQARDMVPASILLEASGNITLANARAYALTGVGRIAIGAITHSAPVLDLSMRIMPAAVEADA
ncbi:MAG: nicotinate-nucleotide diphosphorylase (carboxylating) [Zetaproteobacteria bacterium CG12_big_fil_rev_8_21_14_0_65_54_13]|nr:MAG: nicotinate-nucleotide diphosphorylase (carboxylating) [Zetaproteobacteria bacterium CG23_combo_of_CG06-09_8_20_14_all_54_7]PIW51592.1 MAG: nicotinate-nucleotide diphosphorylase (carboxylating) [Zetaproteobacteria bacterium CG12_big_fil_rev_8_21_14_0_65_54_13]PIX54936.1 MAG: nicotinate-nucleotide diphosphorylase (carboxylating) [Zetaproteobacteria bacterium CG_4_10_14_3_um_filter_54_28]PJA27068.1 MAG: nicotinate-nucleotide diphosphorylase (carboxylating) [Zetaproteobacteria bacterium CG_4